MISGISVVLASGSPRRRHLLHALGVDFTVHVSEVDENIDAGLSPESVVEELALRKASDVARHHESALVIGADTIVVLDGEVLGKPVDSADARNMLKRLSGRTHHVYTGVAVFDAASGAASVSHEVTAVTMAELSDDEISAYVDGGSPMDKAGAYGIQEDLGALFIERIEGDFYAVMGLPVRRLYELLSHDFAQYVSLQSAPTPGLI